MNKRQAVFFLIDTQGANTVGCYRNDLALGTPNIDRLAAHGVRFSAAYTCSPVCGPARSALLTGLYPHSNGVLANDMAPHADLPTLGQRLQRNGIATGYVGKWHLDGGDYFGNGRCPEGWDARFWFDGKNYLESLPNDAARKLSRQVLDPSGVAASGITSEFTHAHRTADRAIEFIRENRDNDFFLFVSIDEPHHPFLCPEPFVSAFESFRFPIPNADDPLTTKPRSQREWSHHTSYLEKQVERQDGKAWLRHPRHFGCNSFSDFQVGRVIAAIDQSAPEALTIYTSDHGDMFGSHRLHGKGPCMYEEIAHIPFVVRWPRKAPVGNVSERPISQIDVAPTILEFFGFAVPDLFQGRSLLSQVCDPATSTNDAIFIEFNRFELDHDGFGAFAPIRCVFDGRHKLVVNLLDADEFYDLAEDPCELHNRVHEPSTATERDRLHSLLIGWMNRTRDPLRGPHWSRRSWSDPEGGSTWGGPTRPRPSDEAWFPKALLYDTAETINRYEYEKY